MPKAFGGSQAPMTTTNGSPGGIRPMPRPAGLGLGGVETSNGGARQGFMGQMTPERYDMAMQMLQSAMSGAAGSNNPALAFLAPIVGGITGAKLQDKRDAVVGAEQKAMTEALLGRQISPQAQEAMDVLNNPNAPDYLKDIARTMLKTDLVPVGQMAAPARRSGGGGSRRSSGGGKSAGGTRPRLYGDIVEFDGVPGKYDGSGKWWPLLGPDGSPAKASGATPAAVPALPALPPDPVIPSDAGGIADEDLINKYLGN